MDKLLIDHWPVVKWITAGVMTLGGAHVWWMVRRIVKTFDGVVDRLDKHESRIIVLETVCHHHRRQAGAKCQ